MSMPIEWVQMKTLADELNMNYRTFKTNYMSKYPPDRKSGNLRWWKRTTVDKIKKEEFGISDK